MKKTIKLGSIHIATHESSNSKFTDYDGNEYLPNEIILIPNIKYKLKIDYPLNIPFNTLLNSRKRGYTRKQIINIICNFYKKVYEEERKSSSIKEQYIKGMYNRVCTDGKYGIWGHILDDLILHSISINKNNVITLGVDS